MTGGAIGARRGAPWWIALAVVLAYGTALFGDFVYDDHHAVQENPALRQLANVPSFFVDLDAFSALDNRMYRPVLLTTYALDHAVGGDGPLVYKLTNLLLHFAGATMAWALCRRLGLGPRPALAAALLLAVHPLGSEAVNTISGRSEVLMVVGLLGGMLTHLAARRGRRGAPALTGLAALVACGSKETGVLLPALLLGLEVVDPECRPAATTRRAVGAAVARLLPPIAVVVAYLLVRRTLFGVATVSLPAWAAGSDPQIGAGRALATQLAAMAVALPEYLGRAVLPVGLSLDPVVHYDLSPGSLRALVGAALLVALTAVGLRAPRRRPAAAVGVALAWATALPWVLVPLNLPVSEHRMYGAVAGLAIATASALDGFGGRWAGIPMPRWAAAGGLAVLAALSGRTAARSLEYRDERSLWVSALACNPGSYRACYSIGSCCMQAGDLSAAREWLGRSLALRRDYLPAMRNVGEVELQLGDAGDPWLAEGLARELARRQPRDPFHPLMLSRALAQIGSRTGDPAAFDGAVARALQVLEIAEPKALVYRTAAHARWLQGDRELALAILDEAIARGVDHPTLRGDRYGLLLELGRVDEAAQELRRIAAADPFHPAVLQAAGAAPR